MSKIWLGATSRNDPFGKIALSELHFEQWQLLLCSIPGWVNPEYPAMFHICSQIQIQFEYKTRTSLNFAHDLNSWTSC